MKKVMYRDISANKKKFKVSAVFSTYLGYTQYFAYT